MRFSLILSTKGRVEEIERFFQSLEAQTFQDFEIILSDQNDDDRLASLVKKWDFGGRMIYLKSNAGLSRGRNMGMDVSAGELIGFPDDDCSYPPTLLAEISAFFDNHLEYGFLTGRSYDDNGKDAASKHAKEAGPIERLKIFTQGIEFVFFIRKADLGALRFDEKMGVGSLQPWHSAEGPDLMLQLLEHGTRGYYDPQYGAWHPRPVIAYDAVALSRSYRYSCGTGYFLRKHAYPFRFLLFLEAKSIAGSLLACLKFNGAKARFYLARLTGHWRGWTHYESYNRADGNGQQINAAAVRQNLGK
jgi:glycosyltransferase involved in cell wall biosynthesis